MSDQTWTDEQLQEHLTQWGVLTGEDRNNFKITLSTKPNLYPLMESSHKLSYEDTSIALTFLQALRVNDWMRQQYELHNLKSEHDGKLDTTHTSVEFLSGEVHIHGGCAGDSESECIYLNASQALSLLAWLKQEEATLEQLAQEQA